MSDKLAAAVLAVAEVLIVSTLPAKRFVPALNPTIVSIPAAVTFPTTTVSAPAFNTILSAPAPPVIVVPSALATM